MLAFVTTVLSAGFLTLGLMLCGFLFAAAARQHGSHAFSPTLWALSAFSFVVASVTGGYTLLGARLCLDYFLV